MRALFILLTVCAAFLVASCSQKKPSKPQPRIEFAQGDIDLGDVAVSDAKFVCDLEFKNVGDDTLRIKTVLASCNCMVAEDPSQKVAKGETGHLTVRLDFTKYNPGPIERTITVFSNAVDSSEYEIFFHCNLH